MPVRMYGVLTRKQIEKCDWAPWVEAQRNAMQAIVLLDGRVDKHTRACAEAVREAGMRAIVGYVERPQRPNVKRLTRAREITDELLLGNTTGGEWSAGVGSIRAYRELAERHGFKWLCGIIPKAILADLRAQAYPPTLEGVECIAFTGHVLAGYLYDDAAVPHERCTSLGGRDLAGEFGLTIERLRAYLGRIDCVSGAGYQEGLFAGTYTYARQMGFRGLIVGLPCFTRGCERARTHAPAASPPRVLGTHAGTRRIHAVALVPGSVAKTRAWHWVTQYCAGWGIELRTDTDFGQYKRNWHDNRHVITWGVRWPRSSYVAGERNVLYVENSALAPKHDVFMDARGYWTDSDLVVGKEWERTPGRGELRDMRRYVEGRFGDYAFAGGDPEGPVMLALQCPRDASLRYYYPDGDGARDVIAHVLQSVAATLADRDVLVRPHPGDRQRFERAGYDLPKRWQVDCSDDARAVLRRCKALVAVNSTLVNEAVAMGVPTATLGRGLFTGAAATLECDDPRTLEGLPRWRCEHAAREKYLCAVLRHLLPYGANHRDVRRFRPLRRWAARARGLEESMLDDPFVAGEG